MPAAANPITVEATYGPAGARVQMEVWRQSPDCPEPVVYFELPDSFDAHFIGGTFAVPVAELAPLLDAMRKCVDLAIKRRLIPGDAEGGLSTC